MSSQPAAVPTMPEKPSGAISAEKVVAPGARPNFLQLPSPVYFTEWISPTLVIIGAGGGGSRFGMANVLVMLSVSTEAQAALGPQAAASRKPPPTPAHGQQSPSTSGAPAVSEQQQQQQPKLWSFVTAIDLGSNIPWCASSYLPFSLSEGVADDPRDGRPAHFIFNAAQRRTLRDTVGFLAVSSIKTFSLMAVQRVRGGKETGIDAAAEPLRLRKLAHIVLPNDERNPDKKPIALVHNAVVVAHDANGVLLYDMASLVPEEAEGAVDEAAGDTTVVTEAVPLAEWCLPARVNDLHANRVNLAHVKRRSARKAGDEGARADGASTSPAALAAEAGEVTALLLDFVVVAAAVQDKTIRLATFRLKRHYDGEREHVHRSEDPKVEEAGASDKGSGTSGVKIHNPVRATFQLQPGEVMVAGSLSLPFQPMASSFRMVRLFGIENVAQWPGATESARRRAVNFSLHTAADGASGEPQTAAADAPKSLPVASLLIVAFDQQSSQSYMVGVTLHASLAFTPSVPWSRAGAAVRSSPSKSGKGGAKENVVVMFHASPCVGPSVVMKDCLTCLSPLHGDSAAVECADAMRTNFFGAAIPTRWLAGTVEGWVVEVETVDHDAPRNPLAHVPSNGRESTLASHVARSFALAASRPVVSGSTKLRKQYAALHKEPVTAVAVSATNDVLSTDLAQNVVISTLPHVLVPATSTAANGLARRRGSPGSAASQQESAEMRPAQLRQTVAGIQLFPPASSTAGFAKALESGWQEMSKTFSRVSRLHMLGVIVIVCLVLALVLLIVVVL